MVRLDGAVETSVQLGVADVIADVVETGSTLRQAGLEVFGEPILESEAVLITRAGAPSRRPGSRCSGAGSRASWWRATYVMMDYDIPTERVEEAVALTPGIESPTVSPLHREGWVAVRAMVPARRRPAADGRAVRARRPRHPAHRHPCLPTLRPRAGPVLPHTWRPFGVRIAGRGARRAGCWRSASRRGSRSATDIRSQFTPFEKLTLVMLGLMLFAAVCYALLRSRLSATDDGADGGQRATAPGTTSGPR